jgi:tetratricopeptide (TPR) repeat protein
LSAILFRVSAIVVFAMVRVVPDARPSATKQDQAATPLSAAPSRSSSATSLDSPPDPLGEARTLAQKGDFDGAVKKYQQLLQEKPKSPDAYAGLTRVYLKKKDVAQAYETVTKGLEVSDAWPIHVALGEVYFRQGKITEAENEWVGVINSGHPSARAYLGLARVRWAIAMNKTAKTMIDKAHELDPRDADIQKYWARTLSRLDRIRYYENYLAGPNASSEEERGDLERYLSYLKEGSKQSGTFCHLVSKVTSTEVPLLRLLLNPEHLRGYGLSVALNGTKTKLMLDTGASGIMVDRNVAERAGITKLAETKVWGIGDKGKKNAYFGMVKSIQIGALEFEDCTVEVVESRSVVGRDGLIGANVFHNFLIDMNFPREKLKLGELPKRPGESKQPLALADEREESDEHKDVAKGEPSEHADAPKKAAETSFSGPQDRYIAPEMESYTHVYEFGPHLLVPTKIGDVPYKLFLLDTGSLNNFISPAAAREVTKVGNSSALVKGLSGSVKKTYSADKAVLQFGRLRQENQDITAFDMTAMSDGAGTEVSGFLGFVMLKFLEIKIDYRDGLVDFTYDRKQFDHF